MKTEETKLQRAKRTLDKAKNLVEKKKLTQAEYSHIYAVLNNLLANNKSEFIQSNVKDFFIKENYIIKVNGIGWTVSW